jgi:hypothetical protein
MMCREIFIFHFSCSRGLKSLTVHSQGSTTTFEKLCVKFIYKDLNIGHFILIYGNMATQSRHFLQNFTMN